MTRSGDIAFVSFKRVYSANQRFTIGLANRRTHVTEFARGFAGEGASNERGVVENGDFRFIRSLSSEHFTYMATRQLSGDTTVMRNEKSYTSLLKIFIHQEW